MIPTDKLFKCNCHNRLSSTQGMVTSLSHGSYILCSSTHLTTIVMALNPYIAVSLKIQKRKCINIDFTFEPDVWNLLRIISVILVAFSTICLLLTIILSDFWVLWTIFTFNLTQTFCSPHRKLMFVNVKYLSHLNLSAALLLAENSSAVVLFVVKAHQSVVSNPPCASITHFHFAEPCR